MGREHQLPQVVLRPPFAQADIHARVRMHAHIYTHTDTLNVIIFWRKDLRVKEECI